MAADNFLGLTNRVLNAFNEVPLTSSDFSSAVGFYQEAQNCVNQGLFDVYSFENVEWPFLYSTLTFDTTRGIINYSKPSTVTAIDWNSFRIKRPSFTLSSLTSVGTVATATTPSAHNLLTGDFIYVDGATPDGYNTSNVAITVTGASTFTYTLATSGLASPATGTITVKSNTVQRERLYFIDTEEYYNTYADIAENFSPDNYQVPKAIAKTANNDFVILDPCDRVYTIEYACWSMPNKLALYSDTHLVPEQWEQAIVDRALHYAYMFRDNPEESQIAEKRALDRMRRMRKAMMPVAPNVNFG